MRQALKSCLWFLLFLNPQLARAQLQYPLSVAVDDDAVYVADRNLPGIWRIADGQAEVYFQGSKTFRTPLNAVRCVALDEKGRLLAGDSSTREVYRFDADRKPVGLTSGTIGIPMAIAVGKDGDLFVADLELHRIWKVPALGGEPVEFAVVPAPRGLTIDAEQRLWVVSHGKNQVLRIHSDKSVEVVVAGRPFEFPHQIAVDDKGRAFVADGYAHAVWRIAADGTTEKLYSGKPLVNPVGLALFDSQLFVADPRQKAVYVGSADGPLEPFFPLQP